jgi:hypothetical protein
MIYYRRNRMKGIIKKLEVIDILLCPLTGTLNDTMFLKLDLFPSSGKKFGGT